jgi:sulfur-oxidizing protein SoxX
MIRTILAITAVGFASAAVAQEVAPADVVYGDYGEVAVSLSGAAGDAEAGANVMSTRGLGNCVACHQVGALEAAFQGNVGPSLDGAADRWDEAQLRGIVANAKLTFPESVMPGFYKVSGFTRPGDAYTGKAAEGELAPLLTAQQIEDVVAYLATLKE